MIGVYVEVLRHKRRPSRRSALNGYVIQGDGCWEWVGEKSVPGYGKLYIKGRGLFAHRFVYEQLVGPIPPGLTIDHLCRNKACVNPAHLEPVTLKENILRSDGVTAVNSRKTHCPKGHPYAGDNLAWQPVRGNLPTRRCLTCRRNWQTEYRRRKTARRKNA